MQLIMNRRTNRQLRTPKTVLNQTATLKSPKRNFFKTSAEYRWNEQESLRGQGWPRYGHCRPPHGYPPRWSRNNHRRFPPKGRGCQEEHHHRRCPPMVPLLPPRRLALGCLDLMEDLQQLQVKTLVCYWLNKLIRSWCTSPTKRQMQATAMRDPYRCKLHVHCNDVVCFMFLLNLKENIIFSLLKDSPRSINLYPLT